MPAKKPRSKSKTEIFDSIRKPVAPPTRKFGDERVESKVHPAGRSDKHKPAKNDSRSDDE